MQKTVCVIGCGASGISSIKHCIEGGLLPTCYEASANIGGLWNGLNGKSVPKCTVTNTCKELSCFSDFPMPDDYPNFMYPHKLLDYFKSYVEKHDLMKYVKLGCEVVRLDVCATHSNCLCMDCVKSAGKYWKVTVESNRERFEVYYDFLIVAVGFNREPFISEEVKEALKGFSGKVLHSSKYKLWEEFENQRVLVCGLGNSGGEIACELSRHASQVYMSTKNGSYVINRLKFSGYPWDARIIRRISNLMPNCFKSFIIPFVCNKTFNHKNFGLEPLDNSPPLPPTPIINDEIWTRISTGKLLMKTNICKTSESTVFFSDGSKVEDIDTIILCTGYKRNFPFLVDKDFGISAEGKFLSLYQFLLPVKHASKAAIIGGTGVQGSVFPVFEMQSRYAVEVFKGNVNLPSIGEMEDSLKRRYLQYKKFTKFQKEPLFVNYISYQDELAELIGAKPHLWNLLWSDPILASRILFGPSCPYQYRLVGPGSWDGARDAILSVDRRIWQPFEQTSKHQSQRGFLLYFFAAMCFLILSRIAYYLIF